jgi:hypothetical protein
VEPDEDGCGPTCPSPSQAYNQPTRQHMFVGRLVVTMNSSARGKIEIENPDHAQPWKVGNLTADAHRRSGSGPQSATTATHRIRMPGTHPEAEAR